MLVGIFQSGIFLFVVVAFYAVDIYFMQQFQAQRQGDARDWKMTAKTSIGVIFLLLQPIILPQLGWQTEATWGLLMQGGGVVLIILATLLNGWSRAHLREFYAERPEVQTHHEVITSGPYAFVRHPIYDAFFLYVIGLFMVNPSVPTLGFLFLGISFVWVARQDEAVLLANLPTYQAYMAKTGRFIPRLR